PKGQGLNVDTGEYEDLVKAGIIDPTMVTRSALQNAASIAKNILTTEAIVAEPPEKTPAGAGAGMPDMGGMMEAARPFAAAGYHGGTPGSPRGPPPCERTLASEVSGAARGVRISGGSCVCEPPGGRSPPPAADGCGLRGRPTARL